MEYKSFLPAAWAEFTNKCKALFPFLKRTFQGTQAEWNALSATEQANYDIVNLTDDVAGGEMIVSDEVTEGDLNPVTSNAVAEVLPPFTLTRLTFVVQVTAGSTLTTITASSDIAIPAGKYLVTGYLMDVDMGIAEGIIVVDLYNLGSALNNFLDVYRPPASAGVVNMPISFLTGVANINSAITIASGGEVGAILDYTASGQTEVIITLNLVKVA